MDKLDSSNSSLYPNIRFRFHIRSNSVDSETLKYLKSFGRETNSMMLEAIRPYWMAIACRDLGFLAGEALQKLAFQAVSALCSRARYLCSTFDLDPAAFGLSSLGSTIPSFPQVQLAASGLVPSVELANPTPVSVPQALVDDPLPTSEESDDTESDDFNELEVEGYSLYAASANL
ncbi:MAG TPA: hypothetical protein DCE56_35265, partial [Cyanobacteria bacterium UBA8553]|nr:hypothetical protein [Cyanobacteria bacterium UBA8553]